MVLTEHSRARQRFAVLSLAALAFLAGCSGEPASETEELETEDVTPALQVDSSEDPQARARGPELVGVLPGDFPSDLPVYLPASLVDYGETADGRPTVSLLTPHEISRVRRELLARLGEAGWSSSAGEGASMVLEKGPRRARLFLEAGRPGTLYSYQY